MGRGRYCTGTVARWGAYTSSSETMLKGRSPRHSTGRGAGTVLILVGEAGTGKTTLIDEARSLAGVRGVAVLHARCSEVETSIPFGMIDRVFEGATLEVVVVRRCLFCGPYYWMRMPEMARDDEPLDFAGALDDGVDHWRIVSFYWSGVLFSKESPHEIRGRTNKRPPGCHHGPLSWCRECPTAELWHDSGTPTPTPEFATDRHRLIAGLRTVGITSDGQNPRSRIEICHLIL